MAQLLKLGVRVYEVILEGGSERKRWGTFQEQFEDGGRWWARVNFDDKINIPVLMDQLNAAPSKDAVVTEDSSE